MVSGIPTASGYEERIRFSEIEVVDRGANEQGLLVNSPDPHEINGWDVNIAGVRTTSVKRTVRYHSHAVSHHGQAGLSSHFWHHALIRITDDRTGLRNSSYMLGGKVVQQYILVDDMVILPVCRKGCELSSQAKCFQPCQGRIRAPRVQLSLESAMKMMHHRSLQSPLRGLPWMMGILYEVL